MTLADVSTVAVIRVAYLGVLLSMGMYAAGVALTDDLRPPAIAAAWTLIVATIAAAAVVALIAPVARVPRSIVGIGVPVMLVIRAYTLAWGLLVEGDTDPGRVALALGGTSLAAVFMPLSWARVVIPYTEAERARRVKR